MKYKAAAILKRGVGVCLNYLSLSTGCVPPAPVGYVQIECTRLCNLRCRMCNIGALSREPNYQRSELTPKAWANIFRNSRYLKLMPKVRVTGGEPFMRRDVPELVSSLLQLGHIDEVAVYTNGYFTDRVVNGVETILTACSSKKRLEVAISLDGMGEKHDEIRGMEGVFDRACATLEGLRKLKQRFPNLSIHSASVIQRDNLEHIAQVDEFRRQIGVESHHMLAMNSSYLANMDHQYGLKTFSEEQKCKIRGLMQDKRESIGLDKYLASGKRPMRCFAGTASLFIARNGDLYPCVAMPYEPDFLMGNAAEGNFDEAWTSARAWQVRRRVRLCSFQPCWGCEITSNRVQYFPLELVVRYASFGFLDYYRLRGLR